jgi:hypothetical protein
VADTTTLVLTIPLIPVIGYRPARKEQHKEADNAPDKGETEGDKDSCTSPCIGEETEIEEQHGDLDKGDAYAVELFLDEE